MLWTAANLHKFEMFWVLSLFDSYLKVIVTICKCTCMYIVCEQPINQLPPILEEKNWFFNGHIFL